MLAAHTCLVPPGMHAHAPPTSPPLPHPPPHTLPLARCPRFALPQLPSPRMLSCLPTYLTSCTVSPPLFNAHCSCHFECRSFHSWIAVSSTSVKLPPLDYKEQYGYYKNRAPRNKKLCGGNEPRPMSLPCQSAGKGGVAQCSAQVDAAPEQQEDRAKAEAGGSGGRHERLLRQAAPLHLLPDVQQ